MKILEFTDSELEEFKHLLKWAISESWDDYHYYYDEEDKKGFKEHAITFEKMYNKFFEPAYKVDEDSSIKWFGIKRTWWFAKFCYFWMLRWFFSISFWRRKTKGERTSKHLYKTLQQNH